MKKTEVVINRVERKIFSILSIYAFQYLFDLITKRDVFGKIKCIVFSWKNHLFNLPQRIIVMLFTISIVFFI